MGNSFYIPNRINWIDWAKVIAIAATKNLIAFIINSFQAT